MTSAEGQADGRSCLTDSGNPSGPNTNPSANTVSVPTREELRARWTCYCEMLGLVRPRVPGSHTKAAVLCPNRKRAGEGSQWRVGDVTEVLVPAMVADPRDFPDNVHRMWKLLGYRPHITWALCLKARSRPNPLWGALAEDNTKDKTIPKTILVPEPWESWAIRSDVVRGSWGGWSGDKPTPDVFRVRGVRGNLTYTEVMKIIKSM